MITRTILAALTAASLALLPGCVVDATGNYADDTAPGTEETVAEAASEMMCGAPYCGTGTYIKCGYKYTYVTSYPGNPSEHINEWRVYTVFKLLNNKWIYIGQETHAC